MTAVEYVSTRDCAAYGCQRHCRDDGDAVLSRISPKGPGEPFVGLCQDHYGLDTVELKPEVEAVFKQSKTIGGRVG